MPLVPSKRFINNSSVVVTPVVPPGSAITIHGVQAVTLDPQSNTVKGAGDADLYNSWDSTVEIDYKLTITTNFPAELLALTPGTQCTISWTMNDARNGATTAGGALIFSISNAVFAPGALTSTHRQLATNTHEFETYSSDGLTSPVASAAA